MTSFGRAIAAIKRVVRFRKPTFVAKHVQDVPDVPERGVVYLVGEDGVLWFAAMICPCGCGADLRMSLHQEGRPRWRVYVDFDRAVTLVPSVWRQVGCRSHFLMKAGEIRWVTSRWEHWSNDSLLL